MFDSLTDYGMGGSIYFSRNQEIYVGCRFEMVMTPWVRLFINYAVTPPNPHPLCNFLELQENFLELHPDSPEVRQLRVTGCGWFFGVTA